MKHPISITVRLYFDVFKRQIHQHGAVCLSYKSTSECTQVHCEAKRVIMAPSLNHAQANTGVHCALLRNEQGFAGSAAAATAAAAAAAAAISAADDRPSLILPLLLLLLLLLPALVAVHGAWCRFQCLCC